MFKVFIKPFLNLLILSTINKLVMKFWKIVTNFLFSLRQQAMMRICLPSKILILYSLQLSHELKNKSIIQIKDSFHFWKSAFLCKVLRRVRENTFSLQNFRKMIDLFCLIAIERNDSLSLQIDCHDNSFFCKKRQKTILSRWYCISMNFESTCILLWDFIEIVAENWTQFKNERYFSFWNLLVYYLWKKWDFLILTQVCELFSTDLFSIENVIESLQL